MWKAYGPQAVTVAKAFIWYVLPSTIYNIMLKAQEPLPMLSEMGYHM